MKLGIGIKWGLDPHVHMVWLIQKCLIEDFHFTTSVFNGVVDKVVHGDGE